LCDSFVSLIVLVPVLTTTIIVMFRVIGKSVEADVTISARGETLAAMQWLGVDELAALCIVSTIDIDDKCSGDEPVVRAKPAARHRCSRCWRHAVIEASLPLCVRCQTVLIDN
jgi:hypothetical protein